MHVCAHACVRGRTRAHTHTHACERTRVCLCVHTRWGGGGRGGGMAEVACRLGWGLWVVSPSPAWWFRHPFSLQGSPRTLSVAGPSADPQRSTPFLPAWRRGRCVRSVFPAFLTRSVAGEPRLPPPWQQSSPRTQQQARRQRHSPGVLRQVRVPDLRNALMRPERHGSASLCAT